MEGRLQLTGFPLLLRSFQIFVDDARQTIILPINGYATPFHINTIKNVSKNEEGDYTYLRINFQSPGQIAGKKEDTASLSLSTSSRLPPSELTSTISPTRRSTALRGSQRYLHSISRLPIYRLSSLHQHLRADHEDANSDDQEGERQEGARRRDHSGSSD